MWQNSVIKLLLIILLVRSSNAAYNTNASIVPGKLNVHLVPHSHDDVGWLQTVDSYYESSVKTILTEVVNRLKEDPNRKFAEVEQAYFQRWWNEQNTTTQQLVKQLVSAGQLEFANGGWCSNDEASTHYVDMIEQMTLGHIFLNQTFGKVPNIGWQIDPFGHSAVQAYLLGTELGFDGLFFARIDYQDRQQRISNKKLEFIWEGSNTLKADNQIFTGVFYRHYNPPQSFEYESDGQILLEDDPSKGTVNINERVKSFIDAANVYANASQTNHVMWTMGDDFKYVDASVWFDQMDKLIHYVNKDGRVNALYSTPSIYLNAIHAANKTWSVKTNDFFPYADGPNSYWTGYFSSRMGLKGYVRFLSGYFQAAKQLEVLIGKKSSGPNTDGLWRALSVLQHHDGVDGTEQQHVANDYAKQLAVGASEAAKVMSVVISCLANGGSISDCRQKEVSEDFVQCPLLNISYCPASEEKLAAEKPLVITVYNALGRPRDEYVQIPVSSSTLIVLDSTGNPVTAQLTPVSNATMNLRNSYVEAYTGTKPGSQSVYSLVFKVNVPPLGFSSYSVRPSKPGENGSAVMSKISNITKMVNQSYYYYKGYDGGGQNSGAYIMRPASNTPEEVISSASPVFIEGPLYNAVQHQYSSWIYQEHRFYNDTDQVEQEFMIGPVPVDDKVGKEVITKFKTNINSNKTFYTDSNGRDFLKRVRDERPDWKYQVVQPVAGNYYPVNLGVYLRDNENDFSVLVDRAMGVSSLSDGEIELMLHRRLLADDSRGVSEPLNEKVCIQSQCEGLTIKGMLYYSYNPVKTAAKWRRLQGQKIYSPLQLFFSTQSKMSTFTAVKSGYLLPENVALLTIQELEDKSILVRLAHIFEADEDEELSNLATVDLKQLLWTWKIQGVAELSLSANQMKSSMKRLSWQVNEQNGEGSKRGGPIDPEKLLVELGPMEVRTLKVFVNL